MLELVDLVVLSIFPPTTWVQVLYVHFKQMNHFLGSDAYQAFNQDTASIHKQDVNQSTTRAQEAGIFI